MIFSESYNLFHMTLEIVQSLIRLELADVHRQQFVNRVARHPGVSLIDLKQPTVCPRHPESVDRHTNDALVLHLCELSLRHIFCHRDVALRHAIFITHRGDSSIQNDVQAALILQVNQSLPNTPNLDRRADPLGHHWIRGDGRSKQRRAGLDV